MIVKALPSNAKEITQVALISKGYWGYSTEQIEDWTNELTVSSAMIEEQYVYVWKENQSIAGFYVLNRPIGSQVELEFLFVLPEYIGKGLGKKLLGHAIETAKSNTTSEEMILYADPNAEPFYLRNGFHTINHKESIIFGRMMPKMTYKLV
uniref:GNAT family N-acetyltransferase n=1 Tax=Polaribacter sp. TaxID=1920175 RepID=UPI0040482752